MCGLEALVCFGSVLSWQQWGLLIYSQLTILWLYIDIYLIIRDYRRHAE